MKTPDIPEKELDPSRINIASVQLMVSDVIGLMNKGVLDCAPEFQRTCDVWKGPRRSRLIESLLLGIPLPSFYFDFGGANGEKTYRAIDGLQRLTAIRLFILGDKTGRKFRLNGLEFLRQYNGMLYDELPKSVRDRLLLAPLQTYVVRPETPTWVKLNIFKRVNTGGVPLNAQELRQGLLHGRGTRFIVELSEEESFKQATRGRASSKRMFDLELINRFLAFMVLDADESYRDLDTFLCDAIRVLNVAADDCLESLRRKFVSTMSLIHEALRERAFAKFDVKRKRWCPQVSKSLFEALSSCVSELSDSDRQMLLVGNRMYEGYQRLFEEEDLHDVDLRMRSSTSDRSKILHRRSVIRAFLRRMIGGEG